MARFRTPRSPVAAPYALSASASQVLVVPPELVVPFLDQLERLGVVVGGRLVVEGERGGVGAPHIDRGIGKPLLLDQLLGSVDRAARRLDPLHRIVEEFARRHDRALADGAVGGVGQPDDLGIVGLQRIALGDHRLQLAGLGVEQLFQLGRILRDFRRAERAQHAVERVERHAVLGGDRLHLHAVEVGQARRWSAAIAAARR